MKKLFLHVLQNERLPCDICGGKCCTFAVFSAAELRRARLANGGKYPPGTQVIHGMIVKMEFGGGEGFIVTLGDADLTCAFLRDGRCSIYDARPRGCRDYGRVPELPCMVLHPKEAQAMFKANLERWKGNDHGI